MTPAAWIVRFAGLLKPQSWVLDLACGNGRHSHYLAALGHRVHAVDRDPVAIAALQGHANIFAEQQDLETERWPLPSNHYDAIVVTHYLHRPHFANLLAGLKPNGVLLYETFAHGNAVYGKPSRPDFLLEANELLQMTAGKLNAIAYENIDTGSAVLQRLAAVGLAYPLPVKMP
jgi:SAM-dependent methyltransferase